MNRLSNAEHALVLIDPCRNKECRRCSSTRKCDEPLSKVKMDVILFLLAWPEEGRPNLYFKRKSAMALVCFVVMSGRWSQALENDSGLFLYSVADGKASMHRCGYQ